MTVAHPPNPALSYPTPCRRCFRKSRRTVLRRPYHSVSSCSSYSPWQSPCDRIEAQYIESRDLGHNTEVGNVSIVWYSTRIVSCLAVTLLHCRTASRLTSRLPREDETGELPSSSEPNPPPYPATTESHPISSPIFSRGATRKAIDRLCEL